MSGLVPHTQPFLFGANCSAGVEVRYLRVTPDGGPCRFFNIETSFDREFFFSPGTRIHGFSYMLRNELIGGVVSIDPFCL